MLFCNMSDSRFFELKALLRESKSRQGQILYTMERLMSKISDFATAMSAFTDRQDAAVAAVQADVSWLKDQIAKLQNSAGEVTAEDQALLDGIQARAGAITDKLDALDALTPPAPPAG